MQNSAEFLPEETSRQVKNRTFGKILTGITGALVIGTCIVTIPFVSPALRRHCLPYVPATNAQVSNIISALKNRTGKVLDLGSGDGRVVFEAAKHNFVSHGVELNPWLVAYSRITALCKGLNAKTIFYRRNLWKFPLTPYDNIIIFGVEQMMPDLEKKILNECNDNCNIIACRFPLPNIRAHRSIGVGIDTVWIYTIKKK